MFKIEDLFPVGKINKAFGLKGNLRVTFETFFIEYVDELKIVFLKTKTGFAPYFINGIEIRPNDVLLHFEDINTKEAAMLLNTKEIFVDLTKFEGLEESIKDENYYGDLIGLDAILINDGNINIGKIEEIFYNHKQELAAVNYKGTEVLIPLHEDTLQSFDDKQAYFLLPEGFIDIYL